MVDLPLSDLAGLKANQVPVVQADVASMAGRSVLLVEDEQATRSGLAIVLRQSGMQVTEVETAASAMRSFERTRPDLIISDIGLPGKDGIELLREIRELEQSRKQSKVPAIALTAFVRDIDRRTAMAAGFQKHLGKPVEPTQLLTAVREALQPELV